MSDTTSERLYNLLPAIYRIRDAEQNSQLRALMAGLESEFQTLEADIDALYDNWFIETCDQWVIPYISELVGINGMSEQKKIFASQRRQVANTIGYRRRKGLTATLEHVIQDVTGWYVHVVEYELRLTRTQHLAHLRQSQGRLADVRSVASMKALSGPFETAAHTIDVRKMSGNMAEERRGADILSGKYLPHNIGIFFWRLQSYPMTRVPASAILKDAITERILPTGHYTFDPFGRDMPLFTLPREVTTLRQRVDVINLPGPIDPVNFALDLNTYRAHHADMTENERELDQYMPKNSTYYGPDRSLCVILNGAPIAPDAIFAADLSQWQPPRLGVSLAKKQEVAIDVSLGRLLFLGEKRPDKSDVVEVSYCYGFSDDLGGGPYKRALFSPPATTQPHTIHVLKNSAISTLRQALDEWEKFAHGKHKPQCIIHIHDNSIYTEEHLVINLPKNSLLVIEAAEGVHPGIIGNLTIQSQSASARLVLSGILFDGNLTIEGNLNLEIDHCTLMPHGLEAQHTVLREAPLQITIDHSIVGPISLRSEKVDLDVHDSILDYTSGYAIDALPVRHESGPTVSLKRVTVFGEVRTQKLKQAEDVIFTRRVFVRYQKDGLVSFCYIPLRSQTPHRDHCHIGPALQPQNGELREPALMEYEGQAVQRERTHPLFTSTRYGNPGYAQLRMDCPPEILRGATDGSEMGAFHNLYQAQRQDNLLLILDEYLPFGLATGVTYIS